MARTGAIAVQGLPAKVAAARREHDKLLAQIGRRKSTLAKLIHEMREAGSSAAARLEPIQAAMSELNVKIHAVFEELLAKGRLPARAQRKVREIYEDLIEQGAILEPPDRQGAFDFELDDEDPEAGEATSAPKPTQDKADALRKVYRRLADAMHPDKVQDEDEKRRRTEAMKDVTVAYGQGDLARLLELERSLLAGGDHVARGDDLETRLAFLERTNKELQAQLRQLDRELRELRRSPHGELARAAKRGEDPLDILIASGEEEVGQLRAIFEHAKAFRDKKISLAAFVRGPEPDDEPELDEEFALELVDAVIAEMNRAMAGGRRGRKPPRRSRG